MCYGPRCTCGTCGAPAVVAFSGKRQYSELLNFRRKGKHRIKNLPLGRQEHIPEVGVLWVGYVSLPWID